jgi:hypothetical protein
VVGNLSESATATGVVWTDDDADVVVVSGLLSGNNLLFRWAAIRVSSSRQSRFRFSGSFRIAGSTAGDCVAELPDSDDGTVGFGLSSKFLLELPFARPVKAS